MGNFVLTWRFVDRDISKCYFVCVCVLYFTDPYQTLGPLSSQLANPGKNLNQCKLNLGRHKWGLYTVRHENKNRLTHLLTFQSGENIKQHLYVIRIAVFSYHKSGFPFTRWLFALLFPHRRPSPHIIQDPNRQTNIIQAPWPQRSQACG